MWRQCLNAWVVQRVALFHSNKQQNNNIMYIIVLVYAAVIHQQTQLQHSQPILVPRTFFVKMLHARPWTLRLNQGSCWGGGRISYVSVMTPIKLSFFWNASKGVTMSAGQRGSSLDCTTSHNKSKNMWLLIRLMWGVPVIVGIAILSAYLQAEEWW